LPALKSRKRRIVPPTAARVSGSKVLKSWSRSTLDCVSTAGIVPPSPMSRPLSAAQVQVDVAVGDAGQRALPHDGAGACAQRRVVLVDRDLDLRQAVVGEADVLDLPHLLAGDRDEVALDELAGVDEPRGDAVALATPARGRRPRPRAPRRAPRAR
jgi:hypothetical protein